MKFNSINDAKKHFNILCDLTLVEDNSFLSSEKAVALTSDRYPTFLQVGEVSSNGEIVIYDDIAQNWRLIWGLFGSMNGTCSGLNNEDIIALYFITYQDGDYRFAMDLELDQYARTFKDLRDCEGVLELFIDGIFFG
ncbi:hypothetical protein [Vibrio vulnificus]|uniref:hypothetical protein n=1 Tax=Vibrio vulnificus TaxID=672 RepID=UPI000A3BCA20|nr:hypothetical protein [Vibrio vulnificus]OUD76359.1 hypothetical protein XM73_u0013 [Vibrio vulnificus]